MCLKLAIILSLDRDIYHILGYSEIAHKLIIDKKIKTQPHLASALSNLSGLHGKPYNTGNLIYDDYLSNLMYEIDRSSPEIHGLLVNAFCSL